MNSAIQQELLNLHGLPDEAALTTKEAALFLRVSVKTLERMRSREGGPAYIQAGMPGSRGINQKCFYVKKDLVAWQDANRVASSMQAALRRGQL